MTVQEELELRRAQLAARDGHAGYKQTCEDLKKRIAELEALNV
jgi:hypothetical protein